MSNTSSNKFMNTLRDYFLDCVDFDGYDNELDKLEGKDSLKAVYETFKSESGRDGQQAFKEWISGLPSCFNVDFENHTILKISKKWGSLPENPTEKQEDKILLNWFNFISFKFFQILKKNDSFFKLGAE